MTNFDDAEQEFLEQDEKVGPSDEERKKRREIMERRSGQELQRKWQQEDRDEIRAAELAAAPPIKSNPKCHTCQSPHRVWIEQKLIQGRAYKQIADAIPDGPSRKSIANHFKECMDIDGAAVRAMLEEEAGVLGQNYEEGVRGAFTVRGALEVMIRRGFEDVLNGVTTAEPRDMVQMMRALGELNANTGQAAMEEAKVAIGIFKEAISNVLIKGDIIEREIGVQLLQAIQDEVMSLRSEQEADAILDRHLALPSGNAADRPNG